jgi:hypothetical protein
MLKSTEGRLMELLKFRLMQFCMYLKAPLGAEEMQRDDGRGDQGCEASAVTAQAAPQFPS